MPVGWVSLGPRAEFARLQRSPVMKPVDERPAGDERTADGNTPAARPGTPAPVRPRTGTHRGQPRWHSLLPGMFR